MEHPSPHEVNEFHRNADTDRDDRALHHTLGPMPNQASPGNHTHDGGSSKRINIADLVITVGGQEVPFIDKWNELWDEVFP